MSVDVGLETPRLSVVEAFAAAPNPESFAAWVSSSERLSRIARLSFRLAGEAVKHSNQTISEETYRRAGAAFMGTAIEGCLTDLESGMSEKVIGHLVETATLFSTFIATLTLIKNDRFSRCKKDFWKYYKKQSFGDNPDIPVEQRDLYGGFLDEVRRITAHRIQGLTGELKAYQFLKACGLIPEKPSESQDLRGVDFLISHKGKSQNVQVKTDRLNPEGACLAWFPTKAGPTVLLNMAIPRLFDNEGVFQPSSLEKALSLSGLRPFQESLNLTLAQIK